MDGSKTMDDKITRRSFVAAAASVGIIGSVSAQDFVPHPDNYDQSYDSYGDDTEVLERYQPALDITPASLGDLIGIYGWYADDYETNTRAVYYWLRYTGQDGILGEFKALGTPASAVDGHFLDHEPVIVFTDLDSGSVKEVITSGYHHYASVAQPGISVALVQARDSRETHPALWVSDAWHNMGFILNDTDRAGLVDNQVPIQSFLGSRRDWFESGVFDDTSTRAVMDPYSMREEPDWWEEGTRDQQMAKIWLFLGLRGADGREELKID